MACCQILFRLNRRKNETSGVSRVRNSKKNIERWLWNYWNNLGTRGRGEIEDPSFQFLVLHEFLCTFPFFVLS